MDDISGLTLNFLIVLAKEFLETSSVVQKGVFMTYLGQRVINLLRGQELTFERGQSVRLGLSTFLISSPFSQILSFHLLLLCHILGLI